MNHLISRPSTAQPPVVDESWWAAILADEERSQSEIIPVAVKTEVARRAPRPAASNASAQQAGDPDLDKPNWDLLQRLYEQDETICLNVTGYNRGGLLVAGDIGSGFVPTSHLVDVPPDLPEAERSVLLAKYVGATLCLKIIECTPDRGRVVFSQRSALAGAGKRNLLFDHLQPGIRVWGTVTNVTDFGVFIDLGGVEGLVHVSELSWGRVRHPYDVTAIGRRIETLIIKLDKDRWRVALSLKRLQPNPWETAAARYTPGQEATAIITSIVSFGAFARLEEGLDGLIHVSALGKNWSASSPWNDLCEGQQVRVRVLSVEADKQRLGLSLCVD